MFYLNHILLFYFCQVYFILYHLIQIADSRCDKYQKAIKGSHCSFFLSSRGAPPSGYPLKELEGYSGFFRLISSKLIYIFEKDI